MDSADTYMQRAICLAKQAMGDTFPNPMVGAVIVKDGEIIGEGFHKKAGCLHAEPNAINSVKDKSLLEGASMYVTLEPCSTTGKTPPCTEAIISSKIKKVYIGSLDKNPDNASRAKEILQKQNIEVFTGILGDKCDDINLIFNHNYEKKQSFFAAKIASTLDGVSSSLNNTQEAITSEASLKNVMLWRKYFPSICLSWKSALIDDPSLTVRLDGQISCKTRFIIDRNLKTSGKNLKVYNDQFANKTIVVCLKGAKGKEFFEEKNIKLWQFDEDNFLSSFKQKCFEEKIYGVYIEGGAKLISSMLSENILDYFFWYISPKIYGANKGARILTKDESSIANCIKLKSPLNEILGDDILMRGYVK